MSDLNDDNWRLKQAIAVLKDPIKNIGFDLLIKELSGFNVLEYDGHARDTLNKIAAIAGEGINRNGIDSARPNEVGNYCEPYVKDAIIKGGGQAETPRISGGKAKSTGYPDIFAIIEGRPFYIEVKTYNQSNVGTTQRSFYLSPSPEFKVRQDAYHLVFAFEMRKDQSGRFLAGSCCILDLKKLKCDLKHEFNSDNRRMYGANKLATIRLDSM